MTTHLSMNGVPVGVLSAEGNSLSFEYAEEWLKGGFELGPDVPLTRGRQFSKTAFGFVEDASPDRWGRTLILRETRARMKKLGQAPRALASLDYFLAVNDESRMGALRARDGEAYVAAGDGVPPLVDLGRLVRASEKYQAGQYDDETLTLLLAPGSSLGGARPKASVRDGRGQLYMAKFPKLDDAYSIERWEYIAFELAKLAGCDVAQARLENVEGRPVLLSKRFDREDGARRHFSSAMNLMGLSDGERSSYAEIADMMQRTGGDPRALFRRMVFNIRINNVDDHLRNHGFLRARQQWELSPVYDINPMSRFEMAPQLSTAIVPDDFEASLELAIDSAEFFNLTKQRARSIGEEVESAVAKWPEVARKARATQREMDEVESAFETR
jgi:serine/threonine-protein kinase HipA